MPTIDDVCRYLQQLAPAALAEEWDNVGLLVGDRSREAARVMTCLTVTPETAGEAVRRQANLIVAHHPLPFRPLKSITADSTVGRLLLELTAARIALYSPHTAFDSAAGGINQRLAAGLGLIDVAPLVVPAGGPPGAGTGRIGRIPRPTSIAELAARAKRFLAIESIQRVGPAERQVQRVAVACGSAGSLLAAAAEAGAELMVLGETTYHTCLEAAVLGVSLVLVGHYASERFAVEALAQVIADEFADATVWASQCEADPLAWD